MIRTRRQLEETKREIRSFLDRLAESKRTGPSARLGKLRTSSFRKVLRQLEDQVALFEKARSGQVDRPRLERLLSPEMQQGRPRIGEAIFILRTAGGLTQAALARKLGTPREVVARWERDDYQGYTLESLRRIFQALGYRLAMQVASVAG